MSNQVDNLFRDSESANAQAIELIGTYDHPLLVLLKQTLTDQQSALRTLVSETEGQDHPPIASFKNACTHVYHANEVSMPFYESWERAVTWMPDPSQAIQEKLGPLMKSMHGNLQEAAQLLESAYGYMAVKYVIPSFYLPAVQEGGA
ncbi:hypothetical protein NCCP2716_10810 [Sporosarcina sp. NCCP-2716]|uniref:hypothetical protein n=1 Tax=Sporosarcina sp. NCCP-2716 TaxID=2943679 RepID=UPI0020411402|nr:hypothetical protein [Sporosarcina sp. NCCP-2716]GKV68583.1 hypothetical protein NCCP2716_10810 [Sporosarcina sp. NCCP-2716]